MLKGVWGKWLEQPQKEEAGIRRKKSLEPVNRNLRLLRCSARVLKSFNPGQWEVLEPEFLNIHISNCLEVSQQLLFPFLPRAFN